MEQRISLVTLGVSDLPRSRAFYEALGWRSSMPADSDVVFFQAGGMVLALWGQQELAADSGYAAPATGSSAPATGSVGRVTLAHNVRDPAAVDAILDEARAAGARIVREGAQTFWGGYSGLFHDPDGHAWEIAVNPDWPLAEDGSVRLPS